MTRKISILSLIFAGATSVALQIPALADDPPTQYTNVYYVSMRGLTVQSSADPPAFVTVSRTQDAAHSSAIAACDDVTIYATPADATAIATSRQNGEVVQLHRGLQGQTMQNSAIMCVIDGQGGA